MLSSTPMCHFTPMEYVWADKDSETTEEWFECRHCGHMKPVPYSKPLPEPPKED